MPYFQGVPKCGIGRLEGERKGCLQYFCCVIDGASGEGLRIVFPAEEVGEAHVVKEICKVHDEHERMLWQHGAGGVKKSWPDVNGIEGMV